MRFAKTAVTALVAFSIALPATASAAAPSGADKGAYSIQPQTGERIPVRSGEPTIIEVVRPERTIVRDVDEMLPLILSGAALLFACAGVGFTLRRVHPSGR